jgi:hypothetical protein
VTFLDGCILDDTQNAVTSCSPGAGV